MVLRCKPYPEDNRNWLLSKLIRHIQWDRPESYAVLVWRPLSLWDCRNVGIDCLGPDLVKAENASFLYVFVVCAHVLMC